MRIVASFDPATEQSDTFNAGFPNGTGKMVVYNESNINLQLSWGAFTTYCPAWTAMLYCVSTNNVNINWQAQSVLNTAGSPLSQVLVEAYDPNEPILGTFPAALVRQTNVGNTVQTSMGGATSLQNDNNPANTQIVESTLSGSPQSNVFMDNSANFKLQQWVSGVLTQLLNIIAGAGAGNTNVQIGDANHTVEILGTLRLDTKILNPAGNSPIVDASGNTDLTLNAPNLGGNHLINFQVGGTTQVTIDSSANMTFQNGGGKLYRGSTNVIDFAAGTDFTINVPNAGGNHKLFITVGGVRVASLDGNGNLILKGTLTENGTP